MYLLLKVYVMLTQLFSHVAKKVVSPDDGDSIFLQNVGIRLKE
jgi:hypothetical protein